MVRLARDSWRLAQTLRRGGFDVIHLNPSMGYKALLRDGALLLIAKVLRTRIVVFVHGWDDSFERRLAKRLGGLFRFVYGRADAFAVLGKAFKEKLRSLGFKGPIFVQCAPVADEILSDSQQLPPSGRFEGGDSRFNILFLARLEKEKGVYEALDAYELLKREHPSVTLTLAGEGSHRESAIAHCRRKQLAGVSFVGHVAGHAKFTAFRAADAYLFPSYGEGLPISVLEAMAYGLPIVTCAVGGLRDFFEDGAMGFMTEKRDPAVLAGLLSRLIRDPVMRRRIHVFNRNYARQQFDGRKIAASLEGIYRFVLEGPDRILLRAG